MTEIVVRGFINSTFYKTRLMYTLILNTPRGICQAALVNLRLVVFY